MEIQMYCEQLIQYMAQIHSPVLNTADRLAHGEGALLIYLAFRHDGATAGELRSWLDVGSGRVANALKSLEGKELIRRVHADRDGRVVAGCITEAGRELSQGRYSRVREELGGLLRELGPADSRELVRITGRLFDIIQNRRQRDCP